VKFQIFVLFALVLLLPITAHAQSSSQEGNCPIGTKPVVNGMNIECVQISSAQKTCPDGTYHGLDNQGNPACRDIKSNQIVDPNTGITTDSQTGQIILDDEQSSMIGIGIIIFIIMIAAIAFATKKKPSSGSTDYRDVKRRAFSAETKETVMERQDGRCAHCHKIPKHWEFDHKRGRGDNSLSNCQGLCRDCHMDKTLKDNW